ncbi:ciliary microtubule inner protein 2B isoform X1 [Mobula hypostoma]|uniref:ciliary microtubule inner protein 2B isoform X1 n=1 Tax=Mobula hypostoma TaxID=723540 RepID=UPI002FC35076
MAPFPLVNRRHVGCPGGSPQLRVVLPALIISLSPTPGPITAAEGYRCLAEASVCVDDGEPVPTEDQPDPDDPGPSLHPRHKYHLGQSYGKLTSKLLRNPAIRHSGQLLLQPNLYRETNYNMETKQNPTLLQSYKASRKAQKLTDSVVSGYTGFIPRSKGYFSKTFTETCMDAFAEFEREQLKAASKKQEMELINALQTGKTAGMTEQEKKLLTVKYRTPFTAITSNPILYDSSRSHKILTSPYLMENEDPNKHFMSGYKGYVPRARFLLGSGYPTITNYALIEFNQMLNKSKAALNSVKQNEIFPQIYPSKLGMLPCTRI